jgi:hypothetical protein
MTDLIIFFLGQLCGGLVVWVAMSETNMSARRNGFLAGVEATLNAEKNKLPDGREVYFINGLWEHKQP